VARALDALPVTAKAFGAGQLSWTQVRAITRVATGDDETSWVELARTATGAQLERLVRGVRRAQRAEEDAADPEQAAWRNEARVSHDEDGTLMISLGLPGEDGAVVLVRDIFWSAPIKDVLSDSERISWITGDDHGSGPSLVVDLNRGQEVAIDAAKLPTPDNRPWHDKQGFKYVGPGCTKYVEVGPKPPTEAVRSRSSIEVALERTLGRHLNVDRDARRLRLLDDKPYPVLEVDICIPELGLVIEYDGSYWHPGREQHDSRKTGRLLVQCLVIG